MRKNKLPIHFKNPSKYMAYCDNSFLNPLKNNKKEKVLKQERKKRKFLLLALKRHKIKSFYLTNKLFIELIGYGRLKKDIIKNNVSDFNSYKLKILNLCASKSYDKSDLQSIFNDIEAFFIKHIASQLPQKKIISVTSDTLKNYPLHKKLSAFSKQIIERAEYISKNNIEYTKLVKILVMNATISTCSDIVNFNQISKQNMSQAQNIASEIVNFILLKYVPQNLLHLEIGLLFSNLEVQKMRQDDIKIERSFKPEKDILDSDLQYPIFYGLKSGRKRYRGLVFTAEPKRVVEQRLIEFYQAITVLIRVNPKYIYLLKQNPREFLLGKGCVFDLKKYQYIQIIPKPVHSFLKIISITKEKLRGKITYSSYTLHPIPLLDESLGIKPPFR